MNSRIKVAASAAVAVIIVAGILVYALSTGPAQLPNNQSTTNSSTIVLSSPKVGDFLAYDCSLPAINSQLSCDVLPTGYVIVPRGPAAPQPSRLQGLTDSAWVLLQKTYSNGVCDPNETWLTDPLDCGATGALANDPYTGRPNAPATVCQQVARA